MSNEQRKVTSYDEAYIVVTEMIGQLPADQRGSSTVNFISLVKSDHPEDFSNKMADAINQVQGGGMVISQTFHFGFGDMVISVGDPDVVDKAIKIFEMGNPQAKLKTGTNLSS